MFSDQPLHLTQSHGQRQLAAQSRRLLRPAQLGARRLCQQHRALQLRLLSHQVSVMVAHALTQGRQVFHVRLQCQHFGVINGVLTLLRELLHIQTAMPEHGLRHRQLRLTGVQNF